MNPSGSIFVFGILFAVAIAIRSTTALPSCNSRLRFLRPDLFKHCESDCRYSDWSEWEQVPNTIGTDVSGTCESGQAFNETRRQVTVDEGCEERAENRTICAPTQTALPSCNSRLRFLRPHLFKHCDCRYSDWSEWEQVPYTIGTDVSGTCKSGQAFNETRRQISVGEECEERAENRTICAPIQMDRLILLLGLGAKSAGTPSTPLRKKRSHTDMCEHDGEHCMDFWDTRAAGKRSTQEEKKTFRFESNEIKHHAPIPFSVSEHGHRFKRQNNKCDPNDKQHVLFVLDTSGSISKEEFHQMTCVVANLTTIFCNDIKVAVLTFSHQIYLEFCFNCFRDDTWAQLRTQAIRDIPYRGGYTATGGAAKCVCDKLLQQKCGVDTDGLDHDFTCIDVIFITDGQSNDNNFEICDEVKCLHDHFLKLNTYSLGIGNYNTPTARSELQCIQDSSNDQSLFWFETFQDFSDQIEEVMKDLYEDLEHTCINTEGTALHD